MKKLTVLLITLSLLLPALGLASTTKSGNRMSLVFRDVPVAELYEMLSRKERVNIILARGVQGNVTVNLYDVTLGEAVQAIAEAAGYAVEERAGGYAIVERKAVAPSASIGVGTGAGARPTGASPATPLVVRPLTVLYSDPRAVADVLGKHVSPGGRLTVLEDRKLLIVEDTAANLPRLESVLREIDREPAQILIEAKILEITLDDTQQFGVDWSAVVGGRDQAAVGVRSDIASNPRGLFFNVVNRDIDLFLNALSNKGRVSTLATPKLLTLENQEAVTNIGDQIGYKVTTTINNVSTESVQFLETGVILRVTPSVDANGRIAMKIKPEVSSGSISGGIPSKKTTEVTTQLIAEDGQSILIGGLIKNSQVHRRVGVPILSDLPAVGGIFGTTEDIGLSTETVVIITPKIVRRESRAAANASAEAPPTFRPAVVEPDPTPAPAAQRLRLDYTFSRPRRSPVHY